MSLNSVSICCVGVVVMLMIGIVTMPEHSYEWVLGMSASIVLLITTFIIRGK